MHSRTSSFDAALGEIEHLLGRRTVLNYGAEARRMVAGSRVLVTGAGGSIGGELVRQLVSLNPQALYMLDHDESLMHNVQLRVFGETLLDHERTVLADIRDARRLELLFEELRPDLVFHAAALKHLPMLERYPSEAVRTNSIGTAAVIDACRAAGTARLVLVSTDKAADPTSVLGASKHMAEELIRGAASPTLRTASVRFGNVLGSRGSFLHTLSHQLEQGSKVTLTHPDVERYFMSIPEAASLVIESAVMASGGEIYVLDMGAPVKIAELVSRFASVNGLPTPQIVITGLRPGEKLSEQLVASAENWTQSSHSQIWKVNEVSAGHVAEAHIHSAFEAALRHDDQAVVSALVRAGYRLDRRGTGPVAVRLPAPRQALPTVAVSA